MLDETTNLTQQLVNQLERIAEHNRESFRYRVDLETRRAALRFVFICEETADRHQLLSGHGPSLPDAIQMAAAGIDDSWFKRYGYKKPE